jgi:transcriptional regulator GlxA family with amidase domain
MAGDLSQTAHPATSDAPISHRLPPIGGLLVASASEATTRFACQGARPPREKDSFLRCPSRSKLTRRSSAACCIQRFERWSRRRLAKGFSLDQAAEALGTSKRTLAGRMQSVLGKSPLAFFQDLRIERAVHRLRTSQASVDQIGAEVGYAEGVTLRALLRRRLGRSVREIRRSQ